MKGSRSLGMGRLLRLGRGVVPGLGFGAAFLWMSRLVRGGWRMWWRSLG